MDNVKFPPELMQFATERQKVLMEEWSQAGSAQKAAEIYGRSKGCYTMSLSRLKQAAARRGYAPEYGIHRPVPPGMRSRGTSILYDSEGNEVGYWNKTAQEGMDPEERVKIDGSVVKKVSTLYDNEGRVSQQWVSEHPELVKQKHALEIYAKELAESIPHTARPELSGTPEALGSKELIALYPVSDHHFGMLAWSKETGGDWDLKIAEEVLQDATLHLMERSSHAKDALIAFMGDFLHYDSFMAITPTNKNLLDTDTRFPKMVRTAIRSMRFMIENALFIHDKVHVIVEIGNHDLSSSIFLMEALRNIYENEDRVTIDTSPKHFHYFKFGKNLIGTHHGHAKAAKLSDLPGIMANDVPEWWGDTRYRYWFTGHVHHDQVKDLVGCRVESLRILAAPDAYAAQSGWRSKQDMKSIIFHRNFGEVSRYTVNPEYLRAEREE